MKVGSGLAAVATAGTLGAGMLLAGPATEAHAADTLACVRVSNNAAGACIYDNGFGHYEIRLWDNKCDHHGVYTQYNFTILGNHKFGPETKCGHNYSQKYYDGNSYPFGSIKVCIEDWGPNTCSHWVDWERY
ncbi:hypothetical protein [Actinocrispum sp. NPDC049592]|uniref:hypothetical protein n=1 Tax=Actinocrispum sp. NPDC049592 TaxID=3154835 RepID=UPI00343C7E51